MKRFIAFAALLTVFAAASPAVAAIVNVGDTIVFSNQDGTGLGGEFGVALAATPSTELFRTFCVEKTEYLNFGYKFNIVGITANAVNGGAGGGSPDPLSNETQYLFYKFATGTLANYTYSGVGRATSADALQNVLWYLEGEQGGTTGGTRTGISTVYADGTLEDAYMEDAWNPANASGVWNSQVKVMNIVWGNNGITSGEYKDGNLAQDNLVLVPEPATIVVWAVLGAASWLGMRVVRGGRKVGRQQWSPENRAAIYDIISR
jgi:hypothetical protein